jgi:putative heme transporter
VVDCYYYCGCSGTAAAFLFLIFELGEPLALLILGISIASALSPFVEWLDERMPRALAVILVFLVMVLIVAIILWIVVPPLVRQAQSAITELPAFFERAQLKWMNLYFLI